MNSVDIKFLKIKKIIKEIKTIYTVDKKIIKFDDTKIEEYEFHQYKSPILINDTDINAMVVSNKFSILLVNKILNISLVTKII